MTGGGEFLPPFALRASRAKLTTGAAAHRLLTEAP